MKTSHITLDKVPTEVLLKVYAKWTMIYNHIFPFAEWSECAMCEYINRELFCEKYNVSCYEVCPLAAMYPRFSGFPYCRCHPDRSALSRETHYDSDDFYRVVYEFLQMLESEFEKRGVTREKVLESLNEYMTNVFSEYLKY